MTGNLNSAALSALAFALLAACSAEPQPRRGQENVKADRSYARASRSAEWVRSRTVYGVHLGMDVDDALKVLSRYGSVRKRAESHSSDDQAWRRAYSITRLRPVRLPDTDLVIQGFGADGRSRSSNVQVLTTIVGKRQVVTGISYGFYGSVDRDLHLGPPTQEFGWLSNGISEPALFFGTQPNLADQSILRDADRCNAPREANHWGPGYSPRCDPETFPSEPYLFVITYDTGLISVQLRDGQVGLAHLRTMEKSL